MPVGYKDSTGTDFDSLFDPYVSGTSPAATGYRDSTGTDLAGRYAPIAVGTKGPDVGYKNVGGTDVSNLWAKAGSASYAGPVAPGFGTNYTVSRTGSLGPGGTLTTTITLTIKPDGTWSVAGNATVVGTPTSGNWHSAPASGVGANCQVRFNGGSWLDLTTAQSISATAQAQGGLGGDTESTPLNVLVELQNKSGTSPSNGNTKITANATSNT